MADIHGSPGAEAQMPAKDGAGPEPVPYTGPDEGAGNVTYAVTGVHWNMPSFDVMSGVSGNAVQESGYAHDINAGLVSPYYAGAVSPVQVLGDADAGGRDVVSGTVAGAVAAREAFYLENEGDTHAQGSVIGDLMTLPPMTATGATLDPGMSPGVAEPSGDYYDPPRSY